MKNQALFSSKDKIKKLKCRLLQFLFGALRVKRCKIFHPNSLRIYNKVIKTLYAILLILRSHGFKA